MARDYFLAVFEDDRSDFSFATFNNLSRRPSYKCGGHNDVSQQRSHNEFTEGILSSVSAAKYPPLQNEVQRIEVDPLTENVIRSVIRSLLPQAVDTLVGAVGIDMTLLDEFKKLYADLPTNIHLPLPFVGTPRPSRLQPARQDVVCTILPVGIPKAEKRLSGVNGYPIPASLARQPQTRHFL